MSTRMTLSLMLLVACAPAQEDSGAARSPSLAAGALGWIEPIGGLPTVATVRWITPLPSQGRVWVREAGAEGWNVIIEEQEPAGEHARVLRGLAAETDYHVRIEPDLGGAAPPIELELTTGALPDWMPATHADLAASHCASDVFFAVPVMVDGRASVAALLDEGGRVVWYSEEPGQVTRVRVTPDRQSLVLLRHSSESSITGSLVWFSWEGKLLRERAAEGLHTDFTFLPDGQVAVLGREVRELTPGRPFLGETIVVFGPDRSEEVVWSVLDAMPPDLGEMYPPCPEAFGAECYSHVNSLAYDDAEDAFLLTAATLGAAMLVDRASGEVRWALGGPASTFTVPGEDKPLGYPHSAQLVDGGVLVFDDRSPLFGGYSGAAEYALDFDARTATPVWSYQPQGPVVNEFLGNAQRLWDGRTLVAVPDEGWLDFVDAAGNLEQRISTVGGAPLRYAQAIQSLYP